VGLERFHTGDKKLKHSALAYFGNSPVTEDLPAWFGTYNGRQTIKAGIKETKQVFFLHRLKVRSEPAIYLQEAMTIFAATSYVGRLFGLSRIRSRTRTHFRSEKWALSARFKWQAILQQKSSKIQKVCC